MFRPVFRCEKFFLADRLYLGMLSVCFIRQLLFFFDHEQPI